ncbi:Cytochrome P450 protein [Amycolatopsis decaplanina DSM 44594]|uniref:Cytochrome P450 protein n=2 Tax=Amycolatopsis decaplanina TaxID=208441 RepID=M2YJU7_9PSEU|nr:Cytochrome P450 protein [Amycolatopsis decaplanina DSM 44594]
MDDRRMDTEGDLVESGPMNAATVSSPGVTRVDLPDGRTVWMVTKYGLARRMLSDTRLTSDSSTMGEMAPLASLPTDVKRIMERDMLSQDPPVHTRMRKLAAPGFTTRAVIAVRPAIERIAGDLVRKLSPRSEVDLVADFAVPLPTLVLGEIFGIPADECAQVRSWSDVFAAGLLPIKDTLRPSIMWLNDYAKDLAGRRRSDPDDGLISRLTADLDDDEVSSMVFLLLVAGQTATTQLIAKGLNLLLTHPEQLDRVRGDRSLLSGAVDELLRYDPPLRVTAFRMAVEPIEVENVTIAAGDVVMCSVTEANRDGERFTDPDRLDVGRQDNQHLAFGHGIHRCLGANLAKAEAEIAFTTLLDRFERIELAVPAVDLRWEDVGIMNQLTALPVRLTPAKAG